MKTVLIGIARMGSTRLPGKVLKKLGKKPVLQWVVDAGRAAPGVDEVWIATSTLPQDDVIQKYCDDNGIKCFRGDETDVLSRFSGAAIKSGADVVVRVTCDCPFLDPRVIGEVVALRHATDADYASNIDPATWPDGLDCEAMTTKVLLQANTKAVRSSDRNTVTQYILRHRSDYRVRNLTCPLPGMHKERWVLDTEADFELCRKIAEGCPSFDYLSILKWMNENPDVRKLNEHHPRNERFFDELVAEEPVARPHRYSQSFLAVAETLIPLGTQTFSKSKLQYPQEAPLFVTHGNGGLVYDIDGNDYVDLVGGLLPVLLGHRDPDVDYAIRAQLDNGISFSVATELEAKVAAKLKQHIPCAEMTRFGKNGSDVTSAAVRLARYITGRDKVLSSGYHGWCDWSIANDPLRSKGVPRDVAALTTNLRHGDINAAREAIFSRQYACVIVEPETDEEFLRSIRLACNATQTILIFDEIITGFRFGLGGAQRTYGVTPDLATFGKSMANGMPISALVGKRQYMEKMTDICFSGTFFGETLSLAAALAAISKMEREPVHNTIRAYNRTIATLVRTLQNKHDVECLTVMGMNLSRITFRDIGRHKKDDLRTLWMQEMIKNGVLVINSHNFMYAHTEADIQRVVNAYDRALEVLADAIRDGNVTDRIVGRSVASTANVRAS